MNEEKNLIEFARSVIEMTWEGSDPSGGDVQEIAERLGLVKRVAFDAAKHRGAGSEYMEEGMDWFEYSGPLEVKK